MKTFYSSPLPALTLFSAIYGRFLQLTIRLGKYILECQICTVYSQNINVLVRLIPIARIKKKFEIN